MCELEAGLPTEAATHFTNALTWAPDLVVRPIAAYYLQKLGKPVPEALKRSTENATPATATKTPGPNQGGAAPELKGTVAAPNSKPEAAKPPAPPANGAAEKARLRKGQGCRTARHDSQGSRSQVIVVDRIGQSKRPCLISGGLCPSPVLMRLARRFALPGSCVGI